MMRKRRRVALCMKKQPKCRRWTIGGMRAHEWGQRGLHCAESLLKTNQARCGSKKGSYEQIEEIFSGERKVSSG